MLSGLPGGTQTAEEQVARRLPVLKKQMVTPFVKKS
jgi:hypothetical protein